MESPTLLGSYNQDGCYSDKAHWRPVILRLLSSGSVVFFFPLFCFVCDYIAVVFSCCCQVNVPQRKATGVILLNRCQTDSQTEAKIPHVRFSSSPYGKILKLSKYMHVCTYSTMVYVFFFNCNYSCTAEHTESPNAAI